MGEWYFIIVAKEGDFLMGPYADQREAEDMSDQYGGSIPFQDFGEGEKEVEKDENQELGK